VENEWGLLSPNISKLLRKLDIVGLLMSSEIPPFAKYLQFFKKVGNNGSSN
jgi:hypothetical protein